MILNLILNRAISPIYRKLTVTITLGFNESPSSGNEGVCLFGTEALALDTQLRSLLKRVLPRFIENYQLILLIDIPKD